DESRKRGAGRGLDLAHGRRSAPMIASMSRPNPSRALLLAAVLLGACAMPPPGLTLAPANSSLARRVADLARSAGGRFGIAALHVESGRRPEWNAAESFEA